MSIIVLRKKRIIWSIILLSAFFIVLFCIGKYNKTAKVASLPTLRKVIIIDPGHGGIDGGMVGKITGVYESKINLEIAFKLRRYLEESGSLVFMTRDENVGLYTEGGTVRKKKNEDLRNRKKLFDESNADLVISIHSNSFQETKYYGAQSFYNPGCERSKLIAELVQEELIRVLDNGNTRKAKAKNDVYILKNVRVPTVIIECGFLSNPKEEKLLQDPNYQEKIAWSIYVGILKYFHRSNI
ncbi:N-acetylmuramoyl-L-alanine amidase CwlD [Wukongibacter sp. M2B1]|uniref:N-acetylmuramoyl-L-alanine amidase CwlD n=1 Tax=Wukongibacter sp. M2B1 TaxID=3088895 RepID=UPI003D7A2FA7